MSDEEVRPEVPEQDEEETGAHDTGPATTMEPMAAKSLPEMSPSDLMDYLNNQEELDKYAYYLTHTSRREKAEARKRLAEKKKKQQAEAADDATRETVHNAIPDTGREDHFDQAPQEQEAERPKRKI